MECPRDHSELKVEDYRGIEVDRCSTCNGMWLDSEELPELESKALAEEELRGTLVYSPRKSEMHCPKCGDPLTAFQYHGRRLELDMCPKGHGYWLDAGEEKDVLEFMEERKRHLRRSASAERQWRRAIAGGRPSLLDRVRGFFGGR